MISRADHVNGHFTNTREVFASGLRQTSNLGLPPEEQSMHAISLFSRSGIHCGIVVALVPVRDSISSMECNFVFYFLFKPTEPVRSTQPSTILQRTWIQPVVSPHPISRENPNSLRREGCLVSCDIDLEGFPILIKVYLMRKYLAWFSRWSGWTGPCSSRLACVILGRQGV